MDDFICIVHGGVSLMRKHLADVLAQWDNRFILSQLDRGDGIGVRS